MIHYAIVNFTTGIIDPDCPHCGLEAATNQADFDNYYLPPNHSKILLSATEFVKANEIDPVEGRYKYKIDKARKKAVLRE